MNREQVGVCLIVATMFPNWVVPSAYTHGPVNELTGHEDVNNYQSATYVINTHKTFYTQHILEGGGRDRQLLKTPILTQDHRQSRLFILYMADGVSQVSTKLR